MKKIIFIVFGLVFTTTVFSQQDPVFTLYYYNMNVVNPAYAGSQDFTEITLNFRSQWVNIPDSPKTQSLSVSYPLTDNLGIGLSIVNDKVFVLKETDFNADISYKIQLSENQDLYFGLKAGASMLNIDLLSLDIIGDPLFSESVKRVNPNVGVGAYLKAENYYISFSAPSILSSTRYDKDGPIVTEASDRAHFYLGGGYKYEINSNVIFKPSIMGRYVSGAPLSLDLTAMFDLYDKVELGVSHRLSESFSGLVFIKLFDYVDFGYAYDYTLTDVRNYSSGTHEFILKFRLNEGNGKRKYNWRITQ